jgi:dihydrofolate synthase / folylpolyglutamate synthase
MDTYLSTVEKIYNLRGGLIDLRLDRVSRALDLFDHPEKKFPSFHIAGTNGKGSTAAMVHRILSNAGYLTGLYTSPHLVSFTERIRINDEEIAEQEVVTLAEEIWQRTTEAKIALTFFEIVTVMAFIFFARRKIDVAVVEVGLGGRLDATNLLRPVASIITTISKDHEEFLGSSLTSIAREKGGIIKQGVPLICGKLPNPAVRAIQKIARELSAPFYFLERDFFYFLNSDGTFDYKGPDWQFHNVSLSLHGRHQRQNAAVAIAALEDAVQQFQVSERAIRDGLNTVTWAGRLEIVREQPQVVLDGAHNGEGIRALVEEIRGRPRRGRVRVLFAVMQDKDWRLMLRELSQVIDEIVLTRVGMERSADPYELGHELTGKVPYQIILDAREALDFILKTARADDTIFVAGSLYLLGEVRPVLTSSTQH